MRLLIVTQKIDINDPVLGFMHRWVEEFSKRFEKVTVICLWKGETSLPASVKVLSLGKEDGPSKIKYIVKFLSYIWQERRNYDAVFVHMNQEYVLLAGDLWRLMGKKVYMWRNHPHGDILTKMAIWLSHKVFYTSTKSFTASSEKSVKMPVGIDTDFFKPEPSVSRPPGSVLFLGRISPIKKVLEFIDWLKEFRDWESVTVAGAALPKHAHYEESVKAKVSEYGWDEKVKFVGAVNQREALRLYQSHEIYVNLTPAGSLDKTILEAAACEMKIFVENEDLKHLERLSSPEARQYVVNNHSLSLLSDKLVQEIK